MRSLRETSSVMGLPIDAGSIGVLQVALVALQARHRLLGRFRRQRLHVGIRAHQSGAHILGHRLGVAADVEMRAAVEPFDQIAALLPQSVLHVDFLGRVAREGDVHAGECAVLERLLPVELVEEIVGELAVAKNNQLRPFAAVARRSGTKARNGATPVPGPTMMMSRSPAGSAKCLLGLSFTRTRLPRLSRSAT